MRRALVTLLIFGILTIWVPARWAPGMFQTGAFVLAAVWLAKWIVGGGRAERSFVPALLALAAVWGLVQLAAGWSVYRWQTWNAALYWGANLALCWVAAQLFSDARARRGLLDLLVWFGLLVSLEAIFQRLSAGGRIFWIFPVPGNDFGMGPFLYKNQYAAFVELLLPVALAAGIRDARRALLYAVVAAVLYASVILAASRAGAALVTAEILIVPGLALAQRRISPRAFLGTAAACVLLSAGFTAAVGWGLLWRRFQMPDLYQGRREMLASTLDMIRARPVTGFGLGTWATVYPSYAYYDDGLVANQAHNDWAQWTAEGGVPFLLVMLAVAGWSLRPAVKSLWGLGVPCVLVHCLVDYPMQKPALAGLVFVMVGMLAGEGGRLKRKPDAPRTV
jgi:O-antigen ligase